MVQGTALGFKVAQADPRVRSLLAGFGIMSVQQMPDEHGETAGGPQPESPAGTDRSSPSVWGGEGALHLGAHSTQSARDSGHSMTTAFSSSSDYHYSVSEAQPESQHPHERTPSSPGVQHVSVLHVQAQQSLPNTQGPTSAANLDIAPAHWHVKGGTLHTQAFVARIELIILSISRVKAVDYQFQFLESMRSSQLGSPSGDWGQSAKEVPGHRACAAHLA